jgi:hypothetical protein
MQIAEPLYKFSCSKEMWGIRQAKAFLSLKQAMASAPVLKHADFKKDFVIFSDASDLGGGAVLSQKHGEEFFPVAYASWLFKDAEINYSTTEREMLALIKAVRKWKPFFLEKKFQCFTDHKALTGMQNLKDPHGRIARWVMLLNEFNTNINYIPGEKNIVPDVMSRHPDGSDKIAVILDPFTKLSKLHVIEAIAANFLTVLPTDKEWAEEQRRDPQLYPLIRYLEHAELPDDDKYAIQIIKKADKFALKGEHKILAFVTPSEGEKDSNLINLIQNMLKLA